jgi:type III pantothenate kinase
MAVLVIDAGNSSTTLACYANGKITRVTSVAGGLRGDPARCAAAARRIVAGRRRFEGAMLASVVPTVNTGWLRLVRRETGLETCMLTPVSRLPMRLDYARPETTGADRLADIAGALARYGAPALVVDIGTAVTYDLVSADLRFFTGVIGPGPDIMARALYDYTALLPELKWWLRPAPRLPKDTHGAMRFGVEAAFCGTLRETVARLLPLFDGGTPRLIATGGFAERFAPPLNMDFIIDPDLTLFGIGWLFDYQRKSP